MTAGDDKSQNATGTLAVALSHGFQLLAKEPAMAAEQAGEILKLFPASAQALVLLGAAKRRLGEASASIAALERALTLSPFMAEALLE
jgi:cytochrome c-type biogenesis protein CcmH/NrfG